MSTQRTAEIMRRSLETSVHVRLQIDGHGAAKIHTGHGFIDHLLHAMTFFAMFDIDIQATGDLATGCHHLFEDIGLALGAAVARALESIGAIHRFGWALVPMDETLVQVALDISGRPLAVVDLGAGEVAGVGTEDACEFLRGLAAGMNATLHVDLLKPGNTHHALEAAFKALGLVLRQAVAADQMRQGNAPSTKGRVTTE